MYKPRQGPGGRLGTDIGYILKVADTISSAVPQEGKVSEKVKYSEQKGALEQKVLSLGTKTSGICSNVALLTLELLRKRAMDWVTLAQRGDLLRQTGGTCPEYVSSGMSEHLSG
ncbi:hypothetical protein J6590_102930 [Homalodisca vitripennis]|nr:hypothetical protein J6590_102930 [Homalodisca vitripennis]